MTRKFRVLSSGLAIIALISLSACDAKKGQGSSGRISPIYNGPDELDYCDNVRTFSDSVTITGTAKYQARQLVASGLGDAGTAQPIRYAEVRVTNSSGTEVQCGETEVDGDFSIALPKGSTKYTIYINARADNNQVKVSVLDRPERNNVYGLSTTVVADQSKSVGTLTAGVTGSILGAPFNIMDKILDANIYLRNEVGDCNSTFSDCANFTVAPKVSVYWEKGFNPNIYFGSSSGVSFYLPGYNRLFILGGINGNVDSADTDHFDNSIILHEYGHFLEDTYTNTDSPGGAHYGNSLIDPRLAWGEGWGNFFQAAVLDDPRYIDTRGNTSGSTSYIFKIDLEDLDAVCTTTPLTPGCDEPEEAGEGNFREFSVTRLLWDAVDNVNDSETITGGFEEIWTTMVSSNYFLNPSAAFRAIGFFHLSQDDFGTSWSTLRTNHLHTDDTTEYAYYVEPDSVACPDVNGMNFTIIPKNDSSDDGSFATSNLLRNNDFFHYKHAGGNLTLTLNYVTTGTGAEADLDLYLYDESARFGNGDDLVKRSFNAANGDKSDGETESITVTNLAAGNYLINVFVYTGGGISGNMTTEYELLTTGGRLCPKDLP